MTFIQDFFQNFPVGFWARLGFRKVNTHITKIAPFNRINGFEAIISKFIDFNFSLRLVTIFKIFFVFLYF